MFLQCLCSSNHGQTMDIAGSSILPPVSKKPHRCIQQSSTICRLGLYAQCSQDVVPREMWRIQAKNGGGGGFHAGRNELCVDSKNQVPNITQLPPRVPNELPMKRYQVPIRRLINHHQLAPVVSLTFLASNQSLPTSSNTWGSHQQWYWCFNKNGEAPN